MQASLAQVGIKLQLHDLSGLTSVTSPGVPNYMHSHNIGIAMGGWAPDWPDGYGFFNFITAGDTISPAGNTNIEELNDPKVLPGWRVRGGRRTVTGEVPGAWDLFHSRLSFGIGRILWVI